MKTISDKDLDRVKKLFNDLTTQGNLAVILLVVPCVTKENEGTLGQAYIISNVEDDLVKENLSRAYDSLVSEGGLTH